MCDSVRYSTSAVQHPCTRKCLRYQSFFKGFLCCLQTSDATTMPPPGVCMNIMNARHKKNGLGTVSKPEKFFNQDFHQLKQYCLIRNVRYIDDMFPPDRRSIGKDVLSPNDMNKVEWLRPHVSVFMAEN